VSPAARESADMKPAYSNGLRWNSPIESAPSPDFAFFHAGFEECCDGVTHPNETAATATLLPMTYGRRILLLAVGLPAVLSGQNSSPIQISGQGLAGYISANIPSPPPGYGHGVSFYSVAWPLLQQPIANFQIGLPSTWIQRQVDARARHQSAARPRPSFDELIDPVPSAATVNGTADVSYRPVA
jgi:hypothetical protein